MEKDKRKLIGGWRNVEINFLLNQLMQVISHEKPNFKILCPYHIDNESEPSMNIDLINDEAHCEGCLIKKTAVEVIGKALINIVLREYYSKIRRKLI